LKLQIISLLKRGTTLILSLKYLNLNFKYGAKFLFLKINNLSLSYIPFSKNKNRSACINLQDIYNIKQTKTLELFE
jgi:hypothetical protein